jgi:hypothetical protein
VLEVLIKSGFCGESAGVPGMDGVVTIIVKSPESSPGVLL